MTYEGARARQVLSAGLTERIHRFAIAEGVTSFVVLLSAFKILLFRFTRNPDILIGTVTAGRNRPEAERLIGLFINNVLLRADLSGDPTVREVLGRVVEVVLTAFAHDDMPLDHLASVLQPVREPNRSPFFQIMFAMLKFPPRKFELAGLTIEPVQIDLGTARFDVTLEVSERDNELFVEWEYRTDLFAGATVRGLQQLYQETLECMLADPMQHLSQLPTVSAADRETLLAWGEPSATPFPAGCAHQAISRFAQQQPEKTAVVFGAQRLSYGDLDRRSTLAAQKLRAAGVAPGSLVSVCAERSVGLIIALLAVWKAGAAYVPLDPEFPADRLRFMLEDSESTAIITEPLLLPILGDRAHNALLLEALLDERDSLEPLVPFDNAKNLAYVIYTSGSTGKPKGVEIEHHALMNFLAAMQRQPGFHSNDRLLAVTTLSFDIAGLELWLPLTTGGEAILAPRSAASNGVALRGLLESSQATVMQATPVSWRLLLESGWNDGRGLKILCGGEALPRELALRLLETGAEVWNLYGPTETTIWSTVQHVQDAAAATVAIGKPIANTTVYVVDENMHLVPRGVAGELVIGGGGLARGYLKRPELTTERFVQSPFRAGQRLYRTGDQARWRSDGTLEYLGRGDTQAKVRGYRIELGEIEGVLEQQPGVQQAVVIVREDAPGDQRLTAYIVPRSGVPLEVRELREVLSTKLPEYMVPPAYVMLDAFPLTPNKKVDRKALPAPQGSAGVVPAAEYQPPGNETERRIADIWRELLRVERVGVTDNFFDLGGHSLLVVQLQSRLAESLQLQVTLVELFQYPTVGALAKWVQRKQNLVEELAPAGGRQ
jgi:amino acid adenylation domain-containing protein